MKQKRAHPLKPHPSHVKCPKCQSDRGERCRIRGREFQYHAARWIAVGMSPPVPRPSTRVEEDGKRRLVMKNGRIGRLHAGTMRASLKRLKIRSYSDYLRGRHWDNFRFEWMRAPTTVSVCYVCGASPVKLHHLDYGTLGRETEDDVVALCDHHHSQAHSLHLKGTPLRVAHIAVAQRFNPERDGHPVHLRQLRLSRERAEAAKAA